MESNTGEEEVIDLVLFMQRNGGLQHAEASLEPPEEALNILAHLVQSGLV